MSEKKYDTCPECGAPCEITEGSYIEEAHEVSYIEHNYKPHPGPVWVKASDRLPENDMFEDYPKEYCLKCKSDGSRGAVEYHQGNVSEIQYMLACGPYDVIWWLDESPAEQPVVWVSAETKPEHNAGVLVFIPGEDNHVTAGMWDISNEWVLLDEYRVPDEEVTHWMPLPAFPEGYANDEIPAEWVSVLKDIAKEETAKKSAAEQPGREVEAVEFAEWITKNKYQCWPNGQWSLNNIYAGTTAQLWEVFKKENPAEWSGEKEGENG